MTEMLFGGAMVMFSMIVGVVIGLAAKVGPKGEKGDTGAPGMAGKDAS